MEIIGPRKVTVIHKNQEIGHFSAGELRLASPRILRTGVNPSMFSLLAYLPKSYLLVATEQQNVLPFIIV